MDEALFEKLLHTSEGVQVDFKREQYAFYGGTEDKRVEVLKDILGFANAWRSADSYILIGVDEVHGNRPHIVGISPENHLKDNDLQQYVNSKTNRTINFSYSAFSYRGMSIGVIHIPLQERPFYLKERQQHLNKDLVFVRIGSSTDPMNPAKPDEVYSMGKLYHAPPPVSLAVELADARSGVILKSPALIQAVRLRPCFEIHFCIFSNLRTTSWIMVA